MAVEPKIIDLHVLHFKPTSISSVHPETIPPPALETATSLLASVAGVEALHLGRQLEDENETTWVLATTWASHADADAFAASEQWMPFRAALRSAVDAGDAWETNRLGVVVSEGGDAGAELGERVLGAPCTEVYTALEAEPVFWDGARKFVGDVVAAGGEGGVGGFKGGACGLEKGRGDAGDTVAVMLGWESMQAHFDTKGKPGALIDGIKEHLLSGWKLTTMYHVNFKKL